MPFRKKVLYYGLMLLLTLLTLEGMARIAYFAAYGPGYGGGRPAAVDSPEANAPEALGVAPHPFYGYTGKAGGHTLNAMPFRQRREDTVIIALLGGSVARDVHPFLERALHRYFTANNLPRRPIVLSLALGGERQPQQALIIAHALLLGGEFDLIVNLDGFNEISGSAGRSFEPGVFPFFPILWNKRVGLTAEEILLTGRIGVLRREQAPGIAARATAPWHWSALVGFAARYRQERAERQLVRLNHALAATAAAYSLEKHGPRAWLETEPETLPAAARVWYRGSAALARLAQLAGADYYHFLQPNQYAPDSKPLSPEELQSAYTPAAYYRSFIPQGYPLLREFNRDLQSQGINYFDLTPIFLDRRETLYIDDCCHLNARGNELLAAAMTQRMEPALRRRGAAPPAEPVSPLAAARRPMEPDTLLLRGDFQVYLRDRAHLRYLRADCAPGDVESRFFLHLTPREVSDLPPPRRDQGFDNLDFSFAEAGGQLWQGQCLAQIPLPGYPIAALRTGQYAPGAGELWAGEFVFRE